MKKAAGTHTGSSRNSTWSSRNCVPASSGSLSPLVEPLENMLDIISQYMHFRACFLDNHSYHNHSGNSNIFTFYNPCSVCLFKVKLNRVSAVPAILRMLFPAKHSKLAVHCRCRHVRLGLRALQWIAALAGKHGWEVGGSTGLKEFDSLSKMTVPPSPCRQEISTAFGQQYRKHCRLLI